MEKETTKVTTLGGGPLIDKWDELIYFLGPEGMLNAIFNYLPQPELGDMINALWEANNLKRNDD